MCWNTRLVRCHHLLIFLLQLGSFGFIRSLVFSTLLRPQLSELLGNVTNWDTRVLFLDLGSVIRAEDKEGRAREKEILLIHIHIIMFIYLFNSRGPFGGIRVLLLLPLFSTFRRNISLHLSVIPDLVILGQLLKLLLFLARHGLYTRHSMWHGHNPLNMHYLQNTINTFGIKKTKHSGKWLMLRFAL